MLLSILQEHHVDCPATPDHLDSLLSMDGDPFADPVAPSYAKVDSEGAATLALGRNASLTIGSQSLILVGQLVLRQGDGFL